MKHNNIFAIRNLLSKQIGTTATVPRSFQYLTARRHTFATLPDSVKRVNIASSIPNEYPGQVYVFNWQLNADGVTPIKKSSFRITKPLDLKVAGLEQPKTRPLQVKVAPDTNIPEAGGDVLSFEKFDEMSQNIRDALSLSNGLYCPEGHVPKTRVGVRFITNSSTIAPDLLAYLERAPVSQAKPTSQPITVYAFEDNGAEDESIGEAFNGYAIEEVEDFEYDEETGDKHDKGMKSVASVLSCGQTLDINNIVAALQLCSVALEADAKEREAAAAQQDDAAATA